MSDSLTLPGINVLLDQQPMFPLRVEMTERLRLPYIRGCWPNHRVTENTEPDPAGCLPILPSLFAASREPAFLWTATTGSSREDAKEWRGDSRP